MSKKKITCEFTVGEIIMSAVLIVLICLTVWKISYASGLNMMTVYYNKMVSLNKEIEPPKIPFGHFKVDKLISHKTFTELFSPEKKMIDVQKHFYKNTITSSLRAIK